MAGTRTGLRGLTYAKITSGGAGTPMVYTGGKKIADNLRMVNVTYNHEDVKLNLDDHAVERTNSLTDVSLSIECGRITEDMAIEMLGKKDNNGELQTSYKASDPIGLGYITAEVDHGKVEYTGHWFYKVIVSLDSDNANTKEDTTTYGTYTLTAKGISIQLEADGDYVSDVEKTFQSLTEARTWLDGKAGING